MLLAHFKEEAESESGIAIDFPEFEAAIKNMGLFLKKERLKKVFARLLGEQDLENERQGIPKRRRKGHEYELGLEFLMTFLKHKVKNYRDLKPTQIVKVVFMDVLEEQDASRTRKSFLQRRSSRTRRTKSVDEEECPSPRFSLLLQMQEMKDVLYENPLHEWAE